MVILDSISLQRGAKTLLEGADARIHPGQKVALIGANGVGKSSLFELIRHRLQADSGNLQVPADWRLSFMAQEVAASGVPAVEYVLDGDSGLREIEAEISAAEQAGDHQRLAEYYQAFEDIDGYSARVRAEKLLHGLGFSQREVEQPVNSFSGGWRIRLNLAQALMCPSDLLLLDEPTNHLDIDATLWLEDWLRQYPGTLVLISHDRDFIDAVCDMIIHVEHHKLWSYRGNYSAFERQRGERLARDQANFEKQQQRISEIQQFVRRFRAKATKARQAQSRLKELERMEALAPAHVDSPFTFSFPPLDKVSDPLLSISGGAVGYGHHAVLNGVNLSIHPGTRLCLLGANGAGKSTLVRTLAGELPLLDGERMSGEHLRIGYFSQHQVDSLDMDASPLLHLQRLTPAATEQQIRDFLGTFNFRGDMALDTIARFSGGEKARLALAVIVWQKPNLLLLDEPTNHLDLDMRHALTVALQGFEGAVLLVSHDRHLIRNTVDQLMLVSDGRVAPYEGDLQAYSQWLLARVKEAKTAKKEEADSPGQPAPDRKSLRKASAEKRKLLAPLKKQIASVEKKVAAIEGSLEEIDLQLADSALYGAAGKDKLQALLVEQGRLKQQKEQLETDWYQHHEALEALESDLEE